MSHTLDGDALMKWLKKEYRKAGDGDEAPPYGEVMGAIRSGRFDIAATQGEPDPLADLVVGTIICPGVPEHEHKIYRSELFKEYQGTTASIQGLVDERNDYRLIAKTQGYKWEALKVWMKEAYEATGPNGKSEMRVHWSGIYKKIAELDSLQAPAVVKESKFGPNPCEKCGEPLPHPAFKHECKPPSDPLCAREEK